MKSHAFKVFVGTSGWLYSWNPAQHFSWYLNHSGLNAVELNASFYRFPFPSQVKGWAKSGGRLRWAVKVNRFVTHVFQFTERALATWRKFKALFEPLDECIDFYLFQAAPNCSRKAAPKLERFVHATRLGERFAFEARNEDWFTKEGVAWAEHLGITFVSVDAPIFPRNVYNTNGLVYLRMHGRTAWYSHYYTDDELHEVAKRIAAAKPKAAYVFFNNNHDMLENAQRMYSLLTKKSQNKKSQKL